MKRYALIIGIGEYQHWPQLAKPKNDAKAVYELLKAYGNFDEVHLPLLNKRATAAALREKLEYVLLKQGAGAEVLIYFSGHGFTAGPSKYEQQGYLAAYDCRVTEVGSKNELLQAEKGLSFSFLNGLVQEAELAGLAVFLDCCQSEFVIEQALIQQKLGSFASRGYFLSAACRSFEPAWENEGEAYSAYTSAFLSAAARENADEGEITAVDVHREISRSLKGTGQEPISLNYGSDLVVVDYRQVVAAAETVSEECPYQGLRAFTPETKRFFFGREKETRLLRERLNSSNFVAVLGPSGSGKSSVVRAGLVTQLEAEGWQVMTMMPEDQPMANLKSALKPLWAAMPVGEQRRLKALLQDEGILAMAQQLPQREKALLLVDQFEEVFTQCADGKEAARDRFIQGLVAVGEAQTPLALVMTMRSDFVNEWLATGQPPEVMNHHAVYLGPLKGESLRTAIEEPARIQGYRFGEGLSALLLSDVKKEENCLPLLEFALTELWEKRDVEKKALTAVVYEEIGGLKGALNKRAEEVYENLREVDKLQAKRIYLQLVRVGRGDKDTRQRQPKSVLLNMCGMDKRRVIADVIADLVKGRLLVSDGDVEEVAYVDVAHEALLEGWQRFAAWRQEDRDLLRLEQRLKDAYEDWQTKEEGEERDKYLLAGGLLAEVREIWTVLKKALVERRTDLVNYFALSNEHEKGKVALLEEALASVQLQEMSRKVREKFDSSPSQTVELTLTAIEMVGKSQTKLKSEVVYSAQDALHRAWSEIRERLKLESHISAVNAVAFSPQGDCFVSGSYDGTLLLWNLVGDTIVKPFESHSSSVNAVAFSPKGDLIVSGSSDKTLRLWNLEGNAIMKPFEGHSSSVNAVAFSPEGDLIVSGSSDETLRLWDLEGNAIVESFEGHRGSVNAVAFSPEGDRIVSGSSDKTLRLWNLSGNAIGKPFKGHSGLVNAVAFSPEGYFIVSGSSDKTLCLWNLSGNAIRKPFKGHSGSVNAVAFSSQGNFIVSSSSDQTLCLWDLEGNAIMKPFEGHSDSVNAVAFSPEGNFIVSGSSDQTLRLWDLKGSAIMKPFEGHSSSVNTVAFAPQGDFIVSGSGDGTLRLWDLDGNAIGEPFEGHRDWVNTVAFSPRGDFIVSGSGDETLRLWDLDGNAIGEPFEGHRDWVEAVAFSPRGDFIVSGSGDKTLRLWDLDGNAIGEPFEGHRDWVGSAAFSPRGDFIVSGSGDNTLRLWDLDGNTIGEPFEGHSSSVYAVAFSPEGNFIVSGSRDNTLRLWDLDGNTIGEPFEGHSSLVCSVGFSKKGDRIFSGSDDGTARLWDLSGNILGKRFEGHSGLVNNMAFSAQGDRIISGRDDGTLRLWQASTWEDELRYCCNMLMHHTALAFPQTEVAHQACKVCQQVWTRQQSAEFLVAQGNALAKRGEVDKAAAKYTRAKDLDPDLTIDPTARAQQLADWSQSPTAKP